MGSEQGLALYPLSDTTLPGLKVLTNFLTVTLWAFVALFLSPCRNRRRQHDPLQPFANLPHSFTTAVDTNTNTSADDRTHVMRTAQTHNVRDTAQSVSG